MATPSPTPSIPFAESKRSREFGQALLQKMMQQLTALREEVMSPQNVCNFPHGYGWTFQQQRADGFHSETGKFEKQSTEIAFTNERILSHDLTLIEEMIFDLAERIHEQFMKRLFLEMDETCKRFGRTTNIGKGESLADGILAGLADIQASVDADGEISFPTMFLGEELMEKLKLQMLIRGNSLEQKAAEIRAEAERSAREREAERLAKFNRP